MEVESISALAVLIAVMAIIAFVAAAEVSLASTTRSRVRQMIDAGVKRAKVLDTLLNDPARFLSTLMLLKSAAYITGGAVSLWLILRQEWFWAEGIILLAFVGFALVVVQIASRALTLRHTDHVALRVGSAVHVLSWILLPFSWPLKWMGTQVRGETKDITAQSIFLSEDGLRYLINVGQGEGVIEEEEKQMIASIFQLGETIVREIMVPRLDVVALDVDTPINDVLDLIIKKGHSRIPVYEESIDHIVGFLYAKDLLRCFREGQVNPQLRQLLRKASFVPESKKLDELFHDMQIRHVHAAIVVDEYGGTAGLVTIEDLLEEIVGEIQDEYDTEKPNYQQLSPTAYLFNARIDLETVSELVEVDLTEDNDVDTLGGFIYNQLGRVPEKGETVEYAGRHFTVLSVDARRIGQVRVEWHEPVLQIKDELAVAVKAIHESKNGTDPSLRSMT